MAQIKILTENVANKIAAGEVIERPGSIVKELIENSLDAGATSIEISIRHGGRSLIRVADNGTGMDARDAELAFKRHATSKITDIEDLQQIASYGFRGEALPSIAAVARVRMVTRTPKQATGVEIVVEGGQILSVKECPAAPGTTLEVRDLFFNTPARRKFMKSEASETGYITDLITYLSLPRLDVGFTFKSQDQLVFQLPPGQTLKNRAAIFFDQEAKSLLEIHAENKGVKLSGLIGKPQVCRANRTGQIFYVNQRYIKSIGLSHALQAGYHGLLMHGQYPVSVLFLDLDPERVDVNVHPTKQEVRISNEAEAKSFLKETINEALQTESLTPHFKVTQAPQPSFVSSFQTPTPSFFKTATENLSVAEPVASYLTAPAQVLPEKLSIRNQLHITKILGQVHGTFILAETQEGYMIVDQHAAHERVKFEAMRKAFKSGKPNTQKLLMEEFMELNPMLAESLEESLEGLTRLGFQIEKFGPQTFVIRGVPAALAGENANELLRHFIEEKVDGKLHVSLENYEEEIATMIACKRQSVRAHDPLGQEGMHSLLAQLAQCENPFSCPHGRPTFMQQTFLDLEKQFKRK